jgi:Ca-activated chloride channel family protein
LTLDADALRVYLDILDTQLIGIQGTALSDAIRSALSLFKNQTSTKKLIILLTDGEDQGDKSLESAREAQERDIRIYTIGIGSEEGEPIPLTDESGNRIGHKKDDQGNIVLTRLDENILQEISRISGGRYFRATSGLMEIDKILGDIKKLEKGALGKSLLFQYEEGFQVPLLLVLIGLFCIEFLGDKKGLLLRVRRQLIKSEIK